MVPLGETKKRSRLTARRSSPQDSGVLGDRVAQWLLTIPWSQYLAVLAGFYLLAASLFAAGLRLAGGLPASPSASYADAFVMSLQALSVFACGRILPATPIAKGIAASAIFVGWLGLLLVLSMTMVRFIRLRPLSGPDGPLLPEPPSAEETPPSRAQALN